jgi:hypothetical protein
VKTVQASVLMVKPLGTVMPRRHISARLAPLPPSRFFMAAAPSVRRWRRSGIGHDAVGGAHVHALRIVVRTDALGALARIDDIDR